MWTNCAGIGSIRTSQPSRLEPAGELRAPPGISVRSSPLPISIAPGLDDDHVAALERAGGDHPPDRDARCPGRSGSPARTRRGATAASSWVTTAPPGVIDARVAREHLVGQGRVGLEEVARVTPARLVGGDHLGVLGARRARGRSVAPLSSVAFEIALVGSQRKLSGGQSRTSRSAPVLGVDAPAGPARTRRAQRRSLDHHPDRLQGAVARAAHLPAVGDRVGDVVERLAA